ncbi:MAG: polymorphic toxin type 23 domain-containing protein [Bacteroidota bacterium]
MRCVAVLVAALAWTSAVAQGSVSFVDGQRWSLGGALTATVGTHETDLGLRADARVWLLDRQPLAVGLRLRAAANGHVQDLGLDGASLGAVPSVELAAAFGPSVRAGSRGAVRSSRRHEVGYRLLGYLDTDGTSQLSGAIRYRRSTDAGVFEVTYENDSFAHLLRDEFRTAALRASIVRTDWETPAGLGLRLVLWTGTTSGLGRLTRDEVYDLSGQLGGDVSHGILAVDAIYGGLTLSVGVDSEAIRSAVQNTFHDLIDDGQIPALDRPARLVVRIALNEGASLY